MDAPAQVSTILFEYPLNERIRTLLRLEDLFERLNFHLSGEHPFQHHAGLATLFEIIEVAARADLKSDLLQELDRQKTTLMGFRNNPAVSNEALDRVLHEIESCWQRLNGIAGKVGQHLRDNEWLMSVRSRTIIPGGACEFDIPSYYAWQQLPTSNRLADLKKWADPFLPLSDSLNIVLRLLRESGQHSNIIAPNGSYQQTLGGKLVQMIQVRVDRERIAIPEISANKYMLWIRFTSQVGDGKPKSLDDDVPFELSLCNL